MSHPAATLKELLEEKSKSNPKSLLLLFEDRSITYGDFQREVNRVANALLHLGARKGDKIALLLPNCPEFLFVVFAAAEIGAVLVPVNTAFMAEEVSYVVDHSESFLLHSTPIRLSAHKRYYRRQSTLDTDLTATMA